jgi:hypothetical protein
MTFEVEVESPCGSSHESRIAGCTQRDIQGYGLARDKRRKIRHVSQHSLPKVGLNNQEVPETAVCATEYHTARGA